MSTAWPSCSAPSHPSQAVFYFARLIAGTKQDVSATTFREPWQLGVYLTLLLEKTRIVSVEDTWDGSEIVYDVTYGMGVLSDGSERGKRFWGKLVGGSYSDLISEAKKHADVEVPKGVLLWLKMSSGESQTMHELPGGSPPGVSGAKNSPAGPPDDVAGEIVREKSPRASRVKKTRSSGDGVLTLGDVCAEEGVDPGRVRGLLRGRGVAKPDGGWAWAEGDALGGTVMDAIKAVKRGEKK